VPELHWQKSTYSDSASNCIYLATARSAIRLRESTAPGVVLTASRAALRAFITAAKADTLDATAPLDSIRP
jgi:Domain of unknown function (DUF397)